MDRSSAEPKGWIQLCLWTPALYLPGILLGFRWYFIAMALGFCYALHARSAFDAVPLASRKIGAALMLWLSVSYLSTLWSIDAEGTLLSVIYISVMAVFWLIGFVASMQLRPLHLVRFFSLCVALIAPVFAYMFLVYGTVRPITAEVTRVFGAGSNAGAMLTVVALPMLIWQWQVRRTWSSLLLILLAIVIVAASQSRAGYLSMAVAFMLWTVLHKNQKYSQTLRFVFGVSLVFILGLAATAVSPRTMARLMNVGLAFSDPSVLVGHGQGDFSRLATYYFGWIAFQEHPWLGIGYRGLQTFMEGRVGFGEASHNLLVTLLAETGVPGTLAFMLLIVTFFNHVRKSVAQADTPEEANWRLVIGISMAVTLLNGMFHQVPEFQYFYLLLGIASAWGPVASRSRHDQKSLAGAGADARFLVSHRR